MNVGERPTQLTVRVRKEHIADAVARDSNKCAIAQAIKDAYPRFSRISVDIATIRVSDHSRGLRAMYFTPPVLQNFILNFDRGNKANLKPLVTRCVAGHVVPISKDTPEEKAKKRVKYAKLKVKQAKRSKAVRARLKMLKQNGGPGRVPVVSGGKLPPVAQGKFRTFGLRTLMV